MLEVGLWVKLHFPASTFIIMRSCENLTSARCVHDGQEPTAVMALIKQSCLSYDCCPWWTGNHSYKDPNQAGLSVLQLLSPGIPVSSAKAVFIPN